MALAPAGRRRVNHHTHPVRLHLAAVPRHARRTDAEGSFARGNDLPGGGDPRFSAHMPVDDADLGLSRDAGRPGAKASGRGSSGSLGLGALESTVTVRVTTKGSPTSTSRGCDARRHARRLDLREALARRENARRARRRAARAASLVGLPAKLPNRCAVLGVLLLKRGRRLEHVEHALVLVHAGRRRAEDPRPRCRDSAGSRVGPSAAGVLGGGRPPSGLGSWPPPSVLWLTVGRRVAIVRSVARARFAGSPVGRPASFFFSSSMRESAMARFHAASWPMVSPPSTMPGDQLERFVVVAHGFLVALAQELEIAREVVRARAQIERHVGFVRNREHDAERAFDLGVAKLGKRLLFAGSGLPRLLCSSSPKRRPKRSPI